MRPKLQVPQLTGESGTVNEKFRAHHWIRHNFLSGQPLFKSQTVGILNKIYT